MTKTLLQLAIGLPFLFMLSKGVELKVKMRKEPETTTSKRRWIAAVLFVLGTIGVVGTLYWMQRSLNV